MKKLLGDRVLIEVDNNEHKTTSGVIISKNPEQGEPMMGKVIAVGSGKLTDYGSTINPQVSINDRVIFEYGRKITVDGKLLMLTSGSDIIAILD